MSTRRATLVLIKGMARLRNVPRPAIVAGSGGDPTQRKIRGQGWRRRWGGIAGNRIRGLKGMGGDFLLDSDRRRGKVLQ